MRKVILGIDPGTTLTGYGIVTMDERRCFSVVDYGCIRPPAHQPLTIRYRTIFRAMETLLDQFTPAEVAVETQYVHKNPQSALKLGMACGVVMLAATLREIPIFEYPPSRVKEAIVGSGAASKSQVQKMVQRVLLLSLPPHPEDAADALAVAICHGQSIFRNRLTNCFTQ